MWAAVDLLYLVLLIALFAPPAAAAALRVPAVALLVVGASWLGAPLLYNPYAAPPRAPTLASPLISQSPEPEHRPRARRLTDTALRCDASSMIGNRTSLGRDLQTGSTRGRAAPRAVVAGVLAVGGTLGSTVGGKD